MSEITKKLRDEYTTAVKKHIGKAWSVSDHATLTITEEGVDYRAKLTTANDHTYKHSELHAAIRFLESCGDIVTPIA